MYFDACIVCKFPTSCGRNALLNSGAYSLAQMFHYNGRPLPAAVLVRTDGTATLIRRRDTYEDLITNDVF